MVAKASMWVLVISDEFDNIFRIWNYDTTHGSLAKSLSKRFKQSTEHSEKTIIGYWYSNTLGCATQLDVLSVMTWTTFFMPYDSMHFDISQEINASLLTSPNVSNALRKILL